MGLLSKLLKMTGEVVKKAGQDVKDALENAKEKEDNPTWQESNVSQSANAAYSAVEDLAGGVTAPGSSWGPTMPSEPNQYNFPGNYVQYFETVFKEEFPDLRTQMEPVPGSRATVATLWDGERKALVVELLNKNSVRQRLRRDCGRAGIPYLRFYHDCHGWWNTRSYVKGRVEKALENRG